MKSWAARSVLWALAFSPVTAAMADTQNHADQAMDAVLTRGDIRPLAAVAAVRLHKGQIIYSYYGGFAKKTEAYASPVNADTLFRIASVSKVVTTIGLMELVEQGKIALDHDASDYVGFRLRNPDFPDSPITLRMLLNHTSTIRDADGYTIPPGQKISDLFSDSRKPGQDNYHFAHGEGHKPGNWFQYCNLCYGVIGTIIERVSGERFDHYQQTHVLMPLAIDGGYNITELTHPERLATLYRHPATGYEAEVDMDPSRGWSQEALDTYTPGTNGTLFSPQGGLRIALTGLVRLARFMEQRGTLDGVHLLSPESIRLMETPTWHYDGHNGMCSYPIASYGLSMISLTGQKDSNGRPTVPWRGYRGDLKGHLGDAYGLHSGFWYDPGTGDAFLFAADGYPEEEHISPGVYSSFTRVEEKIFTALAGIIR
ncbi:serine hydrolase domain-containing protein [Acetobacter fallax]|uniref:Serine hydrolase n=1 Tax=Acetobacter fallax TaxID=1737473 RepID=A0ABX0KIX9_9PROT|nr:serine hydrolase domain-containing protein [Acetobacter fallax]NHO34335.1 serine hydrolase [Acetobacter fallax]NHO37904.1 serine hydrolase [Acetobacter fallax]